MINIHSSYSPKVLSLFSGCGGLDLGFEAAGFEIALASDILPEACLTMRKNFPNKVVFGPPNQSGDIGHLTSELVSELTSGARIDMIIGGPPCQPFSVAAAQRFLKTDSKFKRKGFDCEDKGQLIFQYANLIIDIRPTAFLIENVPGILSIDGGSGIRVIYDELSQAGYTISDPFVLDAKNYGVPQNRKRAFVIGSLKTHKISPPMPTHALNSNLFLDSYVSVAQALHNFNFCLPNSEIRNHKVSSLRRYKMLLPGEREPFGRVDRLEPHRPSKTIIAGGSTGGGRSHLHPYQARTLSVRENARLQTFPDDYIFYGKNGRQFTQVGNAVPPLLAEVLARKIMEEIFERQVPDKLKHACKSTSFHEANVWLERWSYETGAELFYDDIAS